MHNTDQDNAQQTTSLEIIQYFGAMPPYGIVVEARLRFYARLIHKRNLQVMSAMAQEAEAPSSIPHQIDKDVFALSSPPTFEELKGKNLQVGKLHKGQQKRIHTVHAQRHSGADRKASEKKCAEGAPVDVARQKGNFR